MKQFAHIITVIGGILAFFSFALPWEDGISGSFLANAGEATLVTMIGAIGIAIIFLSFYMLNRYTTWHPLSKIVALVISCISLLLFSIIADVIISLLFGVWRNNLTELSYFLSTFIGLPSLFILAMTVIAICVYISNPQVYLRSWRKVLALIIGGIGIIFCFVLLFIIHDSGINFIMVTFIAAVTIVGVSIYRLIRQSPWKSWSTSIVLISSSTGLCCFLILFLGRSINLKMSENLLYNIQYGAFLTAVGYLLAIIGVLSSIETKDNPESQQMSEEETNTE